MSDNKNNTGNLNTGDWNTGYRNSGHRNTGDRNTGNWNTGNWNTNKWNTGNWNTGDRNTGDYNTGHRNTGLLNTGDYNTGDQNTGDRNTGNWNSGTWNSGDYNTGHRNTGFFCTGTPSPSFFDKPTNLTWKEAYARIPYWKPMDCVSWIETKDMTEQEKKENEEHKTTGGFLRKCEVPMREQFAAAWPSFDEATKNRWKNLPNFDADKFLEIMGVDVRLPTDPLLEKIDELQKQLDALKAEHQQKGGK